jgi:hypothetical protein
MDTELVIAVAGRRQKVCVFAQAGNLLSGRKFLSQCSFTSRQKRVAEIGLDQEWISNPAGVSKSWAPESRQPEFDSTMAFRALNRIRDATASVERIKHE